MENKIKFNDDEIFFNSFADDSENSFNEIQNKAISEANNKSELIVSTKNSISDEEIEKMEKQRKKEKMELEKESRRIKREESKIAKEEAQIEFLNKAQLMSEQENILGDFKQSIYHTKQAYQETIEDKMYSLIKDNILIDEVTGIMKVYDDKKGCYQSLGKAGIRPEIVRIARKHNLSSFMNSKSISSIEDMINLNALADGRVSSFNQGYTAIKVYDRQNNEVDTVILKVVGNRGNKKIRVLKAKPEIHCELFCSLVLYYDQIKDLDGITYIGDDYDSDYYYVDVKFDESCDLYQLMFKDMFKQKSGEIATRNFTGSLFTNVAVQVVCWLVGEGRDGKSVLQKMMKIAFPGMISDLKLNYVNDFQDAYLPGSLMSNVAEVTQEKLRTDILKNMTGADSVLCNVKHKGQVELDTRKFRILMGTNFTDKFVFPGIDNAYRDRFCCVEVSTKENSQRIDSFENKIIFGFENKENGKVVEPQSNNFLMWMLQGAIEVDDGFFSSGLNPEKYGEDIVNFTESMLNKMSPKAEFFEEYEVEVLNDFTGILVDDLLDFYIRWCKQSKNTEVKRTTFNNNISNFLKSNFGLKTSGIDIRCDVEGAKKAALPITIKNFEHEFKRYPLIVKKTLLKTGIAKNQKKYDELLKDMEVNKAKNDKIYEDRLKQEELRKSRFSQEFVNKAKVIDQNENLLSMIKELSTTKINLIEENRELNDDVAYYRSKVENRNSVISKMAEKLKELGLSDDELDEIMGKEKITMINEVNL